MTQIRISLSLAALGILSSCAPKTPPVLDRRPAPAQIPALSQEQSSNLSVPMPKKDVFLDSTAAALQFSKTLELRDSTLVSGMKVPGFSLAFDHADYAQVLRCAASYQAKTLGGVALSSGTSIPPEDLRWAWSQAINQSRSCRIVGTYVVAQDFEDTAAPEGDFYYLLNPCIGAEHSRSGNSDCSFKLITTATVKVGPGFSAELLKKAQQLPHIEGELNALNERAILLAKKVEFHLRACENLIAHDTNMLNFRQGTIRLGAMVVGGSLGYVVGGGPNGALMGAMLIGQIAGMLVSTKVFKLPQQIPNDCIDPAALPPADSKDKAPAAKVKAYEQEFGVQSLVRELDSLLGPSGLIATKQAELQKIVEEMHQVNQSVITLDQAIKKANRLGLDPNDTSTFPSAVPQ